MDEDDTQKRSNAIFKDCSPYDDPTLLPITVFIPRPSSLTIKSINAGIQELAVLQKYIMVSVSLEVDGDRSIGDLLADPTRDIIMLPDSYRDGNQ